MDSGRPEPAAAALARHGLCAVELSAREGLALVNGTQCMTAIGALAVHDALQACRLADITGAMSLRRCSAHHGPSMLASRRYARIPGKQRAPPTCVGCWQTAPSSNRTAAVPRCRTPIRCAACRRFMALAATR